ncbi:MAG: hypothetical protein R2684_13175 [Pyrinomonadaceae bacterium]
MDDFDYLSLVLILFLVLTFGAIAFFLGALMSRKQTQSRRPTRNQRTPKLLASKAELIVLSRTVREIADLLDLSELNSDSFLGLKRRLEEIRNVLRMQKAKSPSSPSDLPPINRGSSYPDFVGPVSSQSPEINDLPEFQHSMVTRLYNRAIECRGEQNEFWRLYSVVKLGNANAYNQHLGKSVAAEFKEVPNGDFIAVKLGAARYAVFLQFDSILTPQAYEDGGVSTLFYCSNYDRTRTYSNVGVTEPALMESSDTGWRLIKKGRLNI